MDRKRLTSTSVAVGDVSRSSIVASTDDSVVPDKDAADSAFHAVAPLRSQGCQLHKILIPAWAQSLRIEEIQLLKGATKAIDRIGAVE